MLKKRKTLLTGISIATMLLLGAGCNVSSRDAVISTTLFFFAIVD